ncbi:hypothetical protein Acor_34150 [Acrocarpospora corrugata]|uniref:HTH tetR-type domain-containing protein n=1 Tax=Acrocarpospora corrugata TaxID=35763 RepID=A0A5M3W2I6_9ACTN|nr:TetR/AcrR family transcriptional regulator [Acrocarpospora corrugata]GES01351.1 hypothetical protein Acor_34150 [Acrocarpospora corrugata]
MQEISPRRRRADAERSVAAILQAAIRVFGERPDASLENVAAVAGVTRQTVYAHFPTREKLLDAVIDLVTKEILAALDEAALDEGPAPAALLRLLDTSWRLLENYPVLMHAGSATPQDEVDRHEPISDRLYRLIRRGQEAGEFDRDLAPTWLVAAFIGIGHAAGAEVASGRMSHAEALTALRVSILRLFGAEPVRQSRKDSDPRSA